MKNSETHPGVSMEIRQASGAFTVHSIGGIRCLRRCDRRDNRRSILFRCDVTLEPQRRWCKVTNVCVEFSSNQTLRCLVCCSAGRRLTPAAVLTRRGRHDVMYFKVSLFLRSSSTWDGRGTPRLSLFFLLFCKFSCNASRFTQRADVLYWLQAYVYIWQKNIVCLIIKKLKNDQKIVKKKKAEEGIEIKCNLYFESAWVVFRRTNGSALFCTRGVKVFFIQTSKRETFKSRYWSSYRKKNTADNVSQRHIQNK